MFRYITVVLTLLAFQPLNAHGDIFAMSTFDSNADGWTLDGSVNENFAWVPGNGNPGGYIQFTDNLNPGSNFIAPSKFLGNWVPFDGVGTIAYDHKIFQVGGSVTNFNSYSITIAGAGGSARWDGRTPSGATQWVTQIVPIEVSSWTVLNGSWNSILSDVSFFSIRGEQVGNNDNPPDIAGIDNVALSFTAVPEPNSLLLVGVCCGLTFLWRVKRTYK